MNDHSHNLSVKSIRYSKDSELSFHFVPSSQNSDTHKENISLDNNDNELDIVEKIHTERSKEISNSTNGGKSTTELEAGQNVDFQIDRERSRELLNSVNSAPNCIFIASQNVEQLFEAADQVPIPDFNVEQENIDLVQNDATTSAETSADCNSSNDLPKKCIRKERQIKRNLGQSYMTSSGKIVPERAMKRLSKCRKDCRNLVSLDDQMRTFTNYWSSGAYKARYSFVQSIVKIASIKRSKVKGEKRKMRKFTVIYYLNVGG